MAAVTLEALVTRVDQQGQYMAVAVAVVAYKAVQAQVQNLLELVAVAQFVSFGLV